jgi:hypothetical protein
MPPFRSCAADSSLQGAGDPGACLVTRPLKQPKKEGSCSGSIEAFHLSENAVAALVIFVAESFLAAASFGAPRLMPSAFSHFPGGVAGARRRYTIMAAIVFVLASVSGTLAAIGFPVLFAVVYPIPCLAMSGLVALICAGIYESFRRSYRFRHPRKLSPEAVARFAAERKIRQAANWRAQIEGLSLPHSLVPGASAEAHFEAAQQEGMEARFSPLVITPRSWRLPRLTRREWIKDARLILKDLRSAEEFFAEQYHGMSPEQQEMLDGLSSLNADPSDAPPEPAGRMSAVLDTTTLPAGFHEEVAILRIPTAQSWKIAAFILYGGWNAAPGPADMLAVAKHWHTKHGANICAIGHGSLEFRVDRPPSNFQDALGLLREYLLFCPEVDVVWSLDAARESAMSLQTARYWTFWWD